MEEEERRRNVPGRRPEILLLDRHIREGDLKFVKKKFKKEYAQMMVQECYTLLHTACNLDKKAGRDEERIEIVRFLVANGCNVSQPDLKNWTSVHYAAYRRNVEIIKILLDHFTLKLDQDFGEKDPTTELTTAIHTDAKDEDDFEKRDLVIKLLLEKGASPEKIRDDITDEFVKSYIKMDQEIPLVPVNVIHRAVLEGTLQLNDPKIDDSIISLLPWSLMGPFISSVTINCPLLTALPLGFAYLNPENVKELTIRPTSKWRKLDALKARETAESIIMYSKAKLEGGIVPMKALRLMVMGGPAVGKTTMVRRLMNLETVENLLSTNGVALGEVKLPNKTTLETWDFGGQAIYRITHQLFLRDYCVYAVLFRLTDPFDVSLNELKFWIESVLSRTVAKDKVKIVLIGTHADRMADKESRAILSNLHKHLIQIYGESKVFPQSMRLKWFKKTNFGNKKDFEIEELKEILAEVSESIQIDAPAPLEIIRVILEEQTFKPLEKISTLHQLIYKVGEEKSIHSLMDPKQRMEFLETLDMLGYLFLVRPRRILSETSPLSVRDEEYEMAVVLDPYWIARLLATLINSFHRPEGGVIDQNQLIHRYWCEKDEQEKKDFLPEYHEDMINLLVQLHILFPLRSFSSQVPSYFIPCLLNEEEPHLNLGLDSVFGARGSEESLILDRMIHIDSHASVPVAIMPLIIVQLMAIGEVRECWQQGCAIEIHSPSTQQPGDGPECYCIVKRSTFDASLNIWMEAVSPRVGGWWMKEIMRAMENMLEEFYHVKYRVEVLYHSGKSGLEIRDCGPCVFPLNKLYKALAQRKVNALCKEKIHCVSLQYLVPDLLIEEASSLSIVSWDDLEVVGQLGRGSFGRVLKCISVTQYQTPNVFTMSSSPSPLTLSSSSPSPSPSPPPSAYPTSSSSFPSKLNSPSAFSAASLRKCEYCRKKKATFYCDQCKKQFLCRSCCESSRHLKRNHSPLQLNQESKKKMKGKQAKRKKFWYAAKVLEPKIRKDSEKGEEENEEESDTLALLQKEFLLEVYTMTGLDHDNIVCLVGITQPLKNPRHGYQQNHAMVMELLGGGGLYEQINFMGMSCAEPIRNLLTTFRNAQSALLFHKLTPEKVQKPPPVKPLESLCEGALGSFQKSTESWKSRVGETFQIEIDKLRKQVICNLKVVHKALQSENFEIDRKEFDSLESGMKEVTQLMRKTAAIYAPLSWSLRLKILFDISLGLAYLHSLNPPMIHRDLKSPNVFLTRSLFQLSIDKQILSAPLAKVGDFGWSVRLLGAPCLYGGERSKTADINPTWAAPEVLVTKGKQFTEKADVYALGIIMWELLVRQMPYSLDLEIDHLVKEYILSGGRPKIPPEIFEKEESPKILEQYIQLMAQCWHQEPASRLPASLVCEKVREMMTGEAALLGEIVKGVQIPGFQQKKEDGVTRLKDQMKEEEGHPVLSQSHSLNISKFSLNELIPSKHEDIQLKVKRVLFAGLNCIWITFMNGFIGVVDVKLLKDGDLSIILCDQEDKHPMEVRAITFQTAGGYVWSGCMSGQLQVWKGEPFSKEKSYDHFEMRGWLRRVKPLMSEEVWVSLETGLLRVYLNQRFGVAEAHIPINQKTVVKLNQGGLDITCPETQNTYRFRDLKKEKKGKEFPSVVVWAKFLEQFIRMQSRSSSLLRLAVSCHNREEGGEKEKNLSSSSLFFEETLVGFLGLEPLGHSVWGLTTSFSMIEFTLKSGQESHGLHRDKLIEVKRTFSIDQATIETRFQNTSKTSITGWGKNSICLSIGNAVGSLQFDKKEVWVNWCRMEDRSSTYFRCMTSVWNSNWNGHLSCQKKEEEKETGKEEEKKGAEDEQKREEERNKDRDKNIKEQENESPQKGPELWASNGSEILIFRPSFDSLPILIGKVPVASDEFLTCLCQTGPNEIWGGTSASGQIMRWAIDTRTPLPPKENPQKGVACLAFPNLSFFDEKNWMVVSGSTDQSLTRFTRMFKK